MYLKHLYVENNGPIENANFELGFNEDTSPKPTILVGSNGSGKTNLLSVIADALFEASSQHFRDIVPSGTNNTRPWFRVIGTSTIRMGKSASATVLNFTHNGKEFYFTEKGGVGHITNLKDRLPNHKTPEGGWETDSQFKKFSIDADTAKDVFENGVYAYFPSNRAESPHWLNTGSLREKSFDLQKKFQGNLNKPIYVERSIDRLNQWLLTVLMDARVDIATIIYLASGDNTNFLPRILSATDTIPWENSNNILRTILGRDDVHLGWAGRHQPKLVVAAKQAPIIPDLDALSAGQALLFGTFGTLLRYADFSFRQQRDPSQLSKIEGVCLIDEIDAHLHIDLQHRALPKLIRLFPRIQFIVSSHSPLFVLGMEKEFGVDGVDIIDMPSGNKIGAEAYSEFESIFHTLTQTKALNEFVSEMAKNSGKSIVFLEGETDLPYFEAAAKALGREDILEKFQFEWIGDKDPSSKQGRGTGKDALNSAFTFLRTNPSLINRIFVFLYDNDANKSDEDHEKLFIRSIPANDENKKVASGIENLLAEAVFSDDMYQTKTKKKGDGGETITKTLDKMRLCTKICGGRLERDTFEKFDTVFDMLTEIQQHQFSLTAPQSS